MIERIDLVNTVHQFLRIHLLQLGSRQNIRRRRFRSPDSILDQLVEVLSLIQFSIDPFFQDIAGKISICFFIDLCICKNFLKQGHCSRHVLLQSFQYYVCTVRTWNNIKVASQPIKLFIDLLQALLRCSQIFHILESSTHRLVVIRTHIKDIHQRENVI